MTKRKYDGKYAFQTHLSNKPQEKPDQHCP